MKKPSVYIILVIVFSIILLNSAPTVSYACSCVEPGPVEGELELSSVVFSGKVIEMKDVNKNNLSQSSVDPIAIVFEVDESWKGLNQTQVLVYTARDSASCGYEFTLNEDYLVFAQETDGELRVGLCSGTTPLTANLDMTALGKSEKPTEQVLIELDGKVFDDQTPAENSNKPLYIFLLFVGVLLIGVYIVRRKKN